MLAFMPISRGLPIGLWNSAAAVKATAVATNTRFPQTIGLECASPGMGVFHLILTPFSPSHVMGGFVPSAMPVLEGPRNDGHTSPAGGRRRGTELLAAE